MDTSAKERAIGLLVVFEQEDTTTGGPFLKQKSSRLKAN